jgi:hypothetical protein
MRASVCASVWEIVRVSVCTSVCMTVLLCARYVCVWAGSRSLATRVCVCANARAHALQRVLAASTSPRVAARSCAAIAAVQPSIWFCSDGARALRRAARPRYRQHGQARAHTMDGWMDRWMDGWIDR